MFLSLRFKRSYQEMFLSPRFKRSYQEKLQEHPPRTLSPRTRPPSSSLLPGGSWGGLLTSSVSAVLLGILGRGGRTGCPRQVLTRGRECYAENTD